MTVKSAPRAHRAQPLEAQWSLALPAPPDRLLELSERFGVSPLLAAVLASRQLNPSLLSSELQLTPNPALREAAGQIVQAIEAGKRIRIHGDYDADGITASSVLMLGLNALGAQAHAFIPHRLNEGYGIHPDKVEEHAASCDLLVTVDCGVTNLDEIERITQAGVQVIVTDHHSPGREVPRCLVVHPALTPNFQHDLHNLTGAGVAYHLLWAVHEALGKPPPLEYADLAAIGIIADVAPLIGENRALVIAGLEQMKRSKHAGLRAVLAQKGLDAPTARDVAFIVAPRINAAGRLGEAEIALEFLTTPSERRALELTIYMDARNVERQAIQARMFDQALELVNPRDPAIVVTHPEWHAGIMGIVASKLLERFYKPVFIVAQGKGSVRSTPGISAVEGLRYSADLLKRFGGHTGAAGFAMAPENFPALEARLHDYARQFPTPVPQVRLDALLPRGAYTPSLLEELARLEPYGEGLRPPLWWLSGPLESAGQMGKTREHYSFTLEGTRGKKWAFSGPERGTRVDAAVALDKNSYGGRTTLEYLAESVRPWQAMTLEYKPDSSEPLPAIRRLDPKAAVIQFRAYPQRHAVYAAGEGRGYLERNFPAVRLIEEGDDPQADRIVLMSLPSAATLRGWLERCELVFSWGEHTLKDLEQPHLWTFEGQKLQADPRVLGELGLSSSLELDSGRLWQSVTLRREATRAFVRYQWAQFYRLLEDSAFARAARALVS